ncbi:trypsin-like serine peptidase [Desulfomonile tiedjei]|uniref:V8-like Glu-specific endopeptidase n=1 Tax=Desulfomonile tiedjei (strain ATCC 49306 / DSM 6799 / DCB-1) TaxID=706587 RepID=I4C6E7_DESTA|nr:serine protease [Desulfomonile tiedjei]AFM25138.1 V8-like Glu-specific endopeptidase [Desulfomonile tiedjei DSM 6799]
MKRLVREILAEPSMINDIIRSLRSGELKEIFGNKIEEVYELLKRGDFDKELPANLTLEQIVLLVGRPVLKIRHGTYELPLSSEWNSKLEANRPTIEKAISSVGRIELREHPRYQWLGTGWFVAENIIVTNRHIAEEFSVRNGEDFVFRRNFRNREMKAWIDMREEYNLPDQIELDISKILYVSNNDYDIALLQVVIDSDEKLTPIELADKAPKNGTDVVVIGYPAKDSRSDFEEMERIFGSIYDVKRLAPGKISLSDQDSILKHDCSTLGGNSGSVVLDINSGKAVGLHFGGIYLEGNWAVSSSKVAEILKEFL